MDDEFVCFFFCSCKLDNTLKGQNLIFLNQCLRTCVQIFTISKLIPNMYNFKNDPSTKFYILNFVFLVVIPKIYCMNFKAVCGLCIEILPRRGLFSPSVVDEL